jgi:hypothetical protein
VTDPLVPDGCTGALVDSIRSHLEADRSGPWTYTDTFLMAVWQARYGKQRTYAVVSGERDYGTVDRQLLNELGVDPALKC